MEHQTIQAEPRARTGKGPNRQLRAKGRIPAIVYGNGKEPRNVSVEPTPIAKLLNGPYGRNTIIDLKIPGEDAPRMVIIRDYHLHVYKRLLHHVDFWEITPETALVLDVPLKRVGRSEAEKAGGHAFQTRYEVRVRCLPANIPEAIEFDMSTIGTGSTQIMASEVPMPEGVEAHHRYDYNVIRVKGVAAMEAMLEAAAAEEEAMIEELAEERPGEEAEIAEAPPEEAEVETE